ncbi:MFS transporter [Brevundimonas sp.]|uniref:MFS transporter n=1 Tax=Brevundimonas sp. TaxID=1871086 RepID=UPI0025EAB7C6|nr:MFS transporter [Brevundimonas sp.]
MEKAKLSFWQIWNMCFGFLGIQIGFGLQNANTSRIFQTLGAEVDSIAILWIAAPLTGLLVQPIVGYMSDRTWGRFGRRRPYFLWGAVLTSLALIFMPLSPSLWIAAGMLWLMDASINITMEPFRAFVGDNLPEEQRTQGFAMQSFFIGVGAVLASLLPWMLSNWFDVSNTAPEGVVPDSVRLAFHIGAACLFIAVMWTVIFSREYSPEEIDRFEAARRVRLGEGNETAEATSPRSSAGGVLWLFAGVVLAGLVWWADLNKEVYILGAGLAAYGLLQIVANGMRAAGRSNGLVEILGDMAAMPATMRQLAVVQFFSWFALFAMWIYATPAVTSFHYQTTDTTSVAYNTGADWVGVLFGAYNGVAALAAFAIPLLAARVGRRSAHAINLSLGGLGLLSFWFIRDPALLWVSMIGVGIAWASILSVPYSILAGALPARKMGVYMGIFNFFIVIPQLVAATILGLLVQRLFGDNPMFALAMGAGSMFAAAVCCYAVSDPVARPSSSASSPT